MERQKKNWRIHRQHGDFRGIGGRLGVDPVIVWMMMNRGIPEEGMKDYLHPAFSDLHDPRELLDGDKAAARIAEAIRNREKIRIIGDYDVDGIMSVYIFHQTFLFLGADADWRIPHRVRDGYGLNPRLVEEAAADGCRLIVTCDNGISAFEAVSLAKGRGMDVVVTDHHTVSKNEEGKDRLPEADVVVDPHRSDDPSSFKEICGAVVAWKISGLLLRLFQEKGSEDPESFWKGLLPFAAMATIADVMTLSDENRSIVSLGLSMIPETENPGLLALIAERNRDPKHISSFDVGFILGPCLNAAGRLQSADLGVELLETKDPGKAKELAGKLSVLNEERKNLTEKGVAEAEMILQSGSMDQDHVLVIYEPDVPESVVGIVAGRIRERTGRPTIILTDGAKSVKGSGRSIPAYPMYDALNEVRDLLLGFGGHPMAAGLSLCRENIDRFRSELNRRCRLTEEDLSETLYIDCDMPFQYLVKHPGLIDDLNLLEPFGNGNEKPVFAESHCAVVRMREIGKERQYLKFTLRGKYGCEIEALYFGDGPALKQELMEFFGAEEVEKAMVGQENRLVLTVAYYPQVNEFQGMKRIQAVLSDVLIPEN